MKKPSSDKPAKPKPKDGHVVVTLDGGPGFFVPAPVAQWLWRVFEMDETFESHKELYEQHRDLWDWIMNNPMPKPLPHP